MILIAIQTENGNVDRAIENILTSGGRHKGYTSNERNMYYVEVKNNEFYFDEFDFEDDGRDSRRGRLSRDDREDRDERTRYRDRDYRDVRDRYRDRREQPVTLNDFQILGTKLHSLTKADTVVIITDSFTTATGEIKYVEPLFEFAMNEYNDNVRARGVVVNSAIALSKREKRDPDASVSLNLNQTA